MSAPNRILKWENARRLSALQRFRTDVVTYFSEDAAGRANGRDAQNAREAINRQLDDVRYIVAWAGINPALTYRAPPMVGGYVQNVDVFLNVFRLDHYYMGLNEIRDLIDQAIGVYEGNEKAARHRTFNPFWYIGAALEWFGSLPFRLIGRAGFDREKAESSVAGRTVKLALELIAAAASVIFILQAVGLWPF
jgi:hypothetical protein